MILSDFLWVELDTGSPDHGVLELSDHAPVDFVTEIFDGRPLPGQDDRGVIVRVLSFWLGIDPDEIEILPGLMDEFIQIPLEISSNGHIVVDLIENIEFV